MSSVFVRSVSQCFSDDVRDVSQVTSHKLRVLYPRIYGWVVFVRVIIVYSVQCTVLVQQNMSSSS